MSKNRQRSFGVFPVALGDIQRDRCGRPVQLIFDFTNSHSSVQERREPYDEGDRFLVDLKAFVIKPAFSGGGDEASFLILIFLLNLIFFLILILLLIFLFR